MSILTGWRFEKFDTLKRFAIYLCFFLFKFESMAITGENRKCERSRNFFLNSDLMPQFLGYGVHLAYPAWLYNPPRFQADTKLNR